MILEGTDTPTAATPGPRVRTGSGLSRRDRSGDLIAGRYRILRLLGEGGMGSVWLALDCVLARPVATKEVREPEDTPGGGSQDSRALREARAASQVSHPGVVRVYDLVVEDDRQWIVMEALSGITLARAIRQDRQLPSERVVAIGIRLLDALRAVHREGLIHGDVKPSNVVLTGAGRPILTDFGLASSARDAALESATHLVGSPPYVAPEVIRTGSRTPAADLFALGTTLYEAAEGRRPFEGNSPTAIARSITHHTQKPAVEGEPLGEVINGLLAKDPRNRLGAEDAHAWLTEIESELLWPSLGADARAARP